MWHSHWGFPFSWLGHTMSGIMGTAFIAGVVLFIIWAVKGFPRDLSSKSDALEVLKRRYAAGEITKEQFEQMKKDIGV